MLGTLLIAAMLQQVPQVPVPDLSPGTRYDASVPTLRSVAGHDFGEEVTAPELVVGYMRALAAAAPDRTRLVEYGRTWEGRPLVALVIASPDRIARLDAVKADLRRLADPRSLSDADAERLIQSLPVVTGLFHGIHGDEISSSGAAMAEAYHLLAARGDAGVDSVLAQSIVLIDPMENPDGRARFVYKNLEARGRWPSADPTSAEHNQPWPGGRSNHYWFDLNRDLFTQSQPETQARVRLYFDFWPHIVADLHEMGGDDTYFFPPTAPPSNPWFGERQIALMDVFGRANATAFDARGFSYFNRDVYDLFYPGYMDMWPMSQGSLGMTYEQASARGLLWERTDGDTLSYADGVLHHFTAAIATAKASARNRERILRDFLAFRRQGIDAGRTGPAEYVLHSHDAGMSERLAKLLVANGIEVHEASGPIRIGTRTLATRGTFVIPASQPAGRMLRSLLDAHVAMDSTFVRRQIERRAQRLPDEIYDLTAWSQSLLWDVEFLPSERPTGASGALVRALVAGGPAAAPAPLFAPPPLPTVGAPLRPARVGYLLPWGTNAAAAVVEALRAGIHVRSIGGSFRLGGRFYPVGTALVRVSENSGDLAARLGAIAARHGAEVIPIDDSYVEAGTSLGASVVRALHEPRVLLVMDAPTSSLSAGWARYVLEQRYGQRTTAVRAASLGGVPIADYDVIVLPSGSYGGVFGESDVERLRSWVSDGGTLITIAGATSWAAGAELLATSAERKKAEGGSEPGAGEPIDYLKAIVPENEAPEPIPGAILHAIADTTHWLAAGSDGDLGVLVEGSRVFAPLTLDAGANVIRYGLLDNLVLSGTVWEEARPQLASKAVLMHQPEGSGQIIAFAEDPNYRAYTEAMQLFFINAVLLGPGR
jgi:hypothetical protein